MVFPDVAALLFRLELIQILQKDADRAVLHENYLIFVA